MSEQELLARIKGGQDSTLEFKTEDIHPDVLAGELVAFANAYGGTLLIGVDDNAN